MVSRARIVAFLASLALAPVAPGVVQPAVAATTFTVPGGPIRPGQAVEFRATVSCAAPVVCSWAAGDGASLADGAVFAHQYAALGTYPVTLTVDPDPGTPGDETGETENVSVVANRAPTGTIRVVPSLPVAGQQVQLAVDAVDADGDAITYAWDADENGVADSALPTAGFTQPFAGVRTVRVTLSDAFGGSTLLAQVVRVTAFPFAAFGAAPAAPVAGDLVTFTSTSQDPDGPLTEEVWDLDGDAVFGDAAGPVAQRAFPAAGVYPVALRVRDAAGVASFAFRDVPVTAPAAVPVAAAQTTPAAPAPTRATRIRPFPVLTIAGGFNRRGARFTRFVVDAPAAARVGVTCAGRGCPFARRTFRPGRIAALERRRLRPGARITVRVTQPGFIGKYTSIVVRRGQVPRRTDRCLRPGSTKASACPAS